MIFKKPFIFIVLIILFFLAGCATLPKETLNLPTYNISGKQYFALKDICDLKGINWQWDSFGGIISLSNDDLEARIMPNSPYAFINGKLIEIKSSPIFHKGIIVVSSGFIDEVIAKLTKIKKVKEKTLAEALPFPIRKIVIDAGHGGKDPGAIGKNGLREKDINLDVAKRLRNELENLGIEVVMTRDSDRFISLSRRCEIANSSGADLFISVHVNANRARKIQGFEVYCARNLSTADLKKIVSSGEGNYLFKNLLLAENSENLKPILLDMIFTQNRAEALTLARCISSFSTKELNLKNRGIKSANFFVLKNTHIPAILIEIGYVSNAAEERYLRNSFYRQQLAESIAKGLTNFQRVCKVPKD